MNLLFSNTDLWKCSYFQDYKKKSDLISPPPRLLKKGNQTTALAKEGKLLITANECRSRIELENHILPNLMKQLTQEILKVDRKSNTKVVEISPLQDYQESPPEIYCVPRITMNMFTKNV